MSNAQRSFHVAVVGATGAVGETMLSILAERDFPVGTLSVLASERSAGGEIGSTARRSRSRTWPPSIRPASRSRCSRPVAACPGIRTEVRRRRCGGDRQLSAFRYDDDVPLVVSEVNPEQVANRPRGIIANPNCSTMQMLVALAPLLHLKRHRAHQRLHLPGRCPAVVVRPPRLEQDRPAAELPGDRSAALPGADRLQPDPAHRRLPGQRLHQGRNEADLGDPATTASW